MGKPSKPEFSHTVLDNGNWQYELGITFEVDPTVHKFPDHRAEKLANTIEYELNLLLKRLGEEL